MHTTTVVDLSSDDDTASRPKIRFIPVQQSDRAKPKKRNRGYNDFEEGPPRHTEVQLEFLDHVVMIWMNRARRGDRTIEMPDSILQSKAQEAAKILKNRASFSPNTWLHAFKIKLKQDISPVVLKGSDPASSMLMIDIIREEKEKLNFFSGGKTSASHHQVVKKQDVIPKVPLEISDLCDSEDEITNDSIETYDEALACLKLIEEYCLCVRNLMAVGLTAQMEEFLRAEQHT